MSPCGLLLIVGLLVAGWIGFWLWRDWPKVRKLRDEDEDGRDQADPH